MRVQRRQGSRGRVEPREERAGGAGIPLLRYLSRKEHQGLQGGDRRADACADKGPLPVPRVRA